MAVAPSVLAADFTDIKAEIEAVEKSGADFLHLDVMDGHFVENITFGPMIVEAIARVSKLPLITHLMISDPAKYAPSFIKAGSAAVSIHFEAMGSGHRAVLEEIRSGGCLAGLAVNPDTSIDEFGDLLDGIDLFLAMTVFPGFGGQKFIPEVMDKIRDVVAVRESKGQDFVIEVDGGVNLSTAGMVREAGGQILVAGSAVFGTDDYSGAIASIRGA
ncbi:MAG: ribulose-phosphate 3-epimerase [Candidatus Krumholzibacteria bacterium]|nr:ribulose-phosphate 3-epimerase [Candidatus Krumholzibacteria bacterium]